MSVQHALSGLAARAEIRVDRWGIPHIKAESLEDLFFAQGVNAARDRLWQIDLGRKRGLGRLAASFGSGYLEQDKAARAFLYRGSMEAEWAAYGEDAQAICTRFAEGINAWIDAIEAGEAPLPPEFALTETRPETWAPEDVVRIRTHALTRNALSEILRAQVLAKADPAADLMRKNLEPPVDAGEAAAPLDEIPLEALDLFRLATAPVTFPEARMDCPLEQAGRWRKVDDLAGVIADQAWTGSNNWAIAAHRTETGRPIMAGDPHRAHGLPSLRYLVHLTAPGLDVIGAGEPSMPGISMGHNGHGAFTQTIFGTDQEDVYVYDLDGERYRGPDGWTGIETADEVFEIRGHASQTHTLSWTVHGPVLLRDAARGRLFALRSVWFEPGACAYFGGLTTMRAKSPEAFREGLKRFATPSLNHLWADVEGNLAWQPAGMAPVRRNWTGLLPAKGDGTNEWDGFHPQSALPFVANPEKGFLHSANEWNLPADFDQDETRIGYEWLEKGRALRIDAVLSEGEGHSVASSQALQTDVISLPGLRLAALVAGLPADVPGRDLLAGWDGSEPVDSAPALLCEWWFTKRLKPALFALTAPNVPPALFAPGDVEGIVTRLENPDAGFGPDPEAARDALLARTLAEAHADLVAAYGADEDAWAWGDLHHAMFPHALSRLDPLLDIGPLAKPGSGTTVMHAAYRGTDFRVTNGASVRFVLDVGNWDASVCINAPGQSGNPDSPHYRDLSEPWSRGEYVPFLYSDAAVEAAVATRIVLTPGGAA
ncbi:penicillin acylase family protein [Albimonas sp. CAU 1670]|uniref:penicillin acylase family protein n=1 Tax=Albimonas sp. CAU 1670 TaxID=3032599 RepID=UPI0023DCBFF7|nr:penicillin acylase family protein [Albimonas sp. CAU 1670]MDF2231305.1 penicillin acylase family protein [Albimonas sp. CAU 1670]